MPSGSPLGDVLDAALMTTLVLRHLVHIFLLPSEEFLMQSFIFLRWSLTFPPLSLSSTIAIANSHSRLLGSILL